MEVCVNLTFPGIDIDILEEVVAVNVINNESSVYIPDGARLASELRTTCTNNNIQHAMLAEIPLTMHLLQWAESQPLAYTVYLKRLPNSPTLILQHATCTTMILL